MLIGRGARRAPLGPRPRCSWGGRGAREVLLEGCGPVADQCAVLVKRLTSRGDGCRHIAVAGALVVRSCQLLCLLRTHSGPFVESAYAPPAVFGRRRRPRGRRPTKHLPRWTVRLIASSGPRAPVVRQSDPRSAGFGGSSNRMNKRNFACKATRSRPSRSASSSPLGQSPAPARGPPGRGRGRGCALGLSHLGPLGLRSPGRWLVRDQRSSNRVIPPSTPTYALSSGPIVTGAKLLLYPSPVPASRR